MRTSRSRPPTSSMEPTPEIRCNCSLTVLSAKCVNARIGMSPAIITDMIACASGSTFCTIDCSASCGMLARASETLSRTSCALTSTFSLRSYWMTTWERPSALVEDSVSMPEIVLTCSSIGSVTSLSMPSGEAPSSTVVIDTTGNSTFGKRSTPTRPSEIQPSTTSAPITMTAKTGRRIETSEIHIRFSSVRATAPCCRLRRPRSGPARPRSGF